MHKIKINKKIEYKSLIEEDIKTCDEINIKKDYSTI